MPGHSKSLYPFLPLGGLLLLTGAIYYPGLHGLFLLDDAKNLQDLGEIAERGVNFYLFGSNAGPAGRPLSLLSFALQYQSWPADPFAFKLVNLLLHIGNGVLIYTLCTLLLTYININPSTGRLFPLSVTALWLLHPLQLSTVLYVVQRMTLLSTLFMLAGVIIYLSGRRRYLEKGKITTVGLTLTGVYLSIVLAILSKETGILLPLYILVLEFALLSSFRTDMQWRRYAVPLLLLPLLMVTLYLFRGGIEGLLASYQGRDYTLSERLLTEANVLTDYLKLILIPTSGSFSLFHDDYRIAKGMLDPPVTLFSLFVIVSFLLSGLLLRKRAKVYSFAVLWFFAGHILESSVINLEIYFEHRNYLPSLGVAIFVIWGLGKLAGQLRSLSARQGVIPAYLLIIVCVTLLEIGLWRDPYLQAQEWVRQHPQSKRAVNNLLNINLILGNKQESVKQLATLRDMDSTDMYPVIKNITIHNCYEGESLSEQEWMHYNILAAKASYKGTGVISELDHLVYQTTHGYCDGLDITGLRSIINTLINNPEFGVVRGNLHDIAATYAVIQHDLEAALFHLDSALGIAADIDRKVFKLKVLIARRSTGEAVSLLHDIKQQLQQAPGASLFYRDTIMKLESELKGQEDVPKNSPDIPGADIE